MESGLWQLWIIFKWLLPAAVGSALAVFIDNTEITYKRKVGLFFFGAFISIIVGGAIVENYHIVNTPTQGLIYFGLGVWGMGIIIQVSKQLPEVAKQIPDAITNIREKWLK